MELFLLAGRLNAVFDSNVRVSGSTIVQLDTRDDELDNNCTPYFCNNDNYSLMINSILIEACKSHLSLMKFQSRREEHWLSFVKYAIP